MNKFFELFCELRGFDPATLSASDKTRLRKEYEERLGKSMRRERERKQADAPTPPHANSSEDERRAYSIRAMTPNHPAARRTAESLIESGATFDEAKTRLLRECRDGAWDRDLILSAQEPGAYVPPLQAKSDLSAEDRMLIRSAQIER